MSMFIGFVIADFDHLKKQQESKSAKRIKQLRNQSVFQVFRTFVVLKKCFVSKETEHLISCR